MVLGRTALVFLIGVLLSRSSVGTPPVAAPRDVRVTVGKPRVVYRGGNYPVLLKLANGWIIADFSTRDGEVHAGRSRSAIMSKDLGVSWQPWDESTRTSHDGSRCVLADGTVVAVSQRSQPIEGHKNRFHGLRWTSTDNWQTVEGPGRTEIQLPDFVQGEGDGGSTVGPHFFGRGFATSDGGVLAAMYANFTPDKKYQSRSAERLPWRSILVRSNDRGETWEYVSTIASQDRIKDPEIRKKWQQGFGEPALQILPDRRMICVMRTGASAGSKVVQTYHDLRYTAIRDGKYVVSDGTKTPNLYMTTSRDCGKTWSDPRPITRARSVCPRLLVLENGILALSFGRLYRPKQGNSFMFSTDGGETWSGRIDVFRGLSSGYTDMVATGPDRILYVFDSVANDPISSSGHVADWIGAVDIRVCLNGKVAQSPKP